VAASICDKMIRRHPHVFPDPITGALASVEDADAQTAAWEAQKKREREARDDDRSALAGIARGLILQTASQLTTFANETDQRRQRN
jgi:ATP diphosphatase